MGHFRPYNERLDNFCGITPVFNKTGIKIFGIADFVACRTFDTMTLVVFSLRNIVLGMRSRSAGLKLVSSSLQDVIPSARIHAIAYMNFFIAFSDSYI